MVKTADCIPLPELERQFYDQSNYRYLRRIIETEGFKPCYPIRAVFNGRKGVYEVFDGTHRLKVAQDLGISRIPLIDETGILTRQQAIAEGIKANKTHAYCMHAIFYVSTFFNSKSKVSNQSWLVGLNFNPRIKVVPLIEVKTRDLFWNRAYHQKWSQKGMKERIVEERNTKYGKRIVKQIEGKIIIQKIREDKKKEDKKKSKR